MKIKNVTQANEALHRIAQLELSISENEDTRDDVINQAKADCQRATTAFEKEKEQLVASLKDYSDQNRDTLLASGKKSVDLANGTIGYRQNPDSIEVSQKTADLLCQLGFDHCVKITKAPVKSALKGFSDDQLSKVEAKRVPGTESFYVQANDIRTSTPITAA